MSIIHISIKINQTDTFTLNVPNGESILTVSLDQGDELKMLRTRLMLDLQEKGFVVQNPMYDFLQFALAVYTIDQTVSRSLNGFQGWSRYLKVYFPVNNLALWQSVKELLEKYIGFLSGDKWEFNFRQNEEIRLVELPLNQNPFNYTQVCLLSGGLDSFIASIDILKRNQEKPFFVSHHKITESSTQTKILQALEERYGKDSFGTQKFYVQPNQKNKTQKENSSRARSLLFITLGLTVANCLGSNLQLILPENGLISLNIPLTRTRLSSHSTRTTHPYFVHGLNQITNLLGISNRIINPYRFKTKGEMMTECLDREFLELHEGETISCSHPEQGRWDKKASGNCGYCVPCIIRQAAELKIGEIRTKYLHDVRTTPPSNKTKKGSDYRAFKMAIQRLSRLSGSRSMAMEIIRSGPIPSDEDSPFSEYLGVYSRGMEEVKQFLNS